MCAEQEAGDTREHSRGKSKPQLDTQSEHPDVDFVSVLDVRVFVLLPK